jgi:hypothetical protein
MLSSYGKCALMAFSTFFVFAAAFLWICPLGSHAQSTYGKGGEVPLWDASTSELVGASEPEPTQSLIEEPGASLAMGFKRQSAEAKRKLELKLAKPSGLSYRPPLIEEVDDALLQPQGAPQTIEGCGVGTIKNAARTASISFFSATGLGADSKGTYLTSVSNVLQVGTVPGYYLAVGHYEATLGKFRAFKIRQKPDHNLEAVQPLSINTTSCGFTESFAFGVSEGAETIVGAGCVNTSPDGCQSDKDLRPLRWGCSNHQLFRIPRPTQWDGSTAYVPGNSGEATAVDGDGNVAVGWAQMAFPSSGDNNLQRDAYRWTGVSCSAAPGTSSNLPGFRNGNDNCDPASTDRYKCYNEVAQPSVSQSGAMAVSRDGNFVVGYHRTRELDESPINGDYSCEIGFPTISQTRLVASRGFFWDARCSSANSYRGLFPAGNSRNPACAGRFNWPRGVARGLSPEGGTVLGEDHTDKINNPSLLYPPNHRWVPRKFTEVVGQPFNQAFDMGGWAQEAIRWNYPYSAASSMGWGPIVGGQSSFDSRLRDASNGSVKMVGQTYIQTPEVWEEYLYAVDPIAAISSGSSNLVSLKAVLTAAPYSVPVDSLNLGPGSPRWHLRDARSVSPDGKVVVGEAICNNNVGPGIKVFGFVARFAN